MSSSLSTDVLISVGVGVASLLAAIATSWFTSEKLEATSAAAKVLRDSTSSEGNDAGGAKCNDRSAPAAPRIETATGAARRRIELEAISALVTSYHEQALSQARAQFWFSVVAASVGFAWIIWSGWNVTTFSEASKILPGIVMDSVAFLFFKQATDTRQRATELYDRLRTDRQVSESISLVASIDDTRVRSAIKAQIALHMSGLQPVPIDLTAVMTPLAPGRKTVTNKNIPIADSNGSSEPEVFRDHVPDRASEGDSNSTSPATQEHSAG